jgi:hypothetical protein
MGLEKNIESKYDGRIVPAFHVIDLVNVNFQENKAQVYGRIFASDQSFAAGRAPLDTFSFVFYDLAAMLQQVPSNIEASAYGWLKTLPEMAGAKEKAPPPTSSPGAGAPRV